MTRDCPPEVHTKSCQLIAVLAARGGIWRGGNVGVEEPAMLRVAGRIAIAIAGVARGTVDGECLAARRLRILPDRCGGKTTLRRRRRICRESASGSERASIVVNPIEQAGRINVCLDVLRGGDVHTLTFVDRHRGAIHAGAKTGNLQRLLPGT